MGFNRFLNQRVNRENVHHAAFVGGVERRELAQNLAAAGGFLRQQDQIVAQFRRDVGAHFLQFLDDQRDCGERRAQLMRGGGGEAIELR